MGQKMITEHKRVTNNLDSSHARQASGKGGHRATISPQKVRVAVGQKGSFHPVTSYTPSRTFNSWNEYQN